MQWLIRLFLVGTLLEARAFATESEFHDVLNGTRTVFRAEFDDLLHVAAFRSDESSAHLELLVVFNLDVETARVFGAGKFPKLPRLLGRVGSRASDSMQV